MKYDNKDQVLQLLHGIEKTEENIEILDELSLYINETSIPRVYIRFGRPKGLQNFQEIDIAHDLASVIILINTHKSMLNKDIERMKKALKSL